MVRIWILCDEQYCYDEHYSKQIGNISICTNVLEGADIPKEPVRKRQSNE